MRLDESSRAGLGSVVMLVSGVMLMTAGISGCDSDSEDDAVSSSGSLAPNEWREYRLEYEDHLDRAEVRVSTGGTASELEVIFPGQLCMRGGSGPHTCEREDMHAPGHIDITIADDSGDGLSYDLTVSIDPGNAEIGDLIVLDEGTGKAPEPETAALADERLGAMEDLAPVVSRILDIATRQSVTEADYDLHLDGEQAGRLSVHANDKGFKREVHFAAHLEGEDRPDAIHTDKERPLVIRESEGEVSEGRLRVRTKAGVGQVLVGETTGTAADLQFLPGSGAQVGEHRLEDLQENQREIQAEVREATAY